MSMSISGWIFLGFVGLLIVLVIFIHKELATLRQRVNQAFADLGVQVAATESRLTSARRELIAFGETYPDLKASTNFQQLQGELSDIENKIAAARRFFNNTLQEYNTGIHRFPAALFAGMLGFSQRDFFGDHDPGPIALPAPKETEEGANENTAPASEDKTTGLWDR
jgi:LemA protein